MHWYGTVQMLGKAGHCARAAIAWQAVSQYLGWLTRDTGLGGAGMAKE